MDNKGISLLINLEELLLLLSQVLESAFLKYYVLVKYILVKKKHGTNYKLLNSWGFLKMN